MPRFPLFTTILGSFLAIAAPARAEPPERKPFLQTYCMDCHDSEMHEGGLDLEKLKFQPAQRANAIVWEHLFDRVSHGEMPPKNKPQPPPGERQAALDALSASLRAASLASQKKEGRGPVRRLTRTEYENTLTDLLGIPCEVAGLFPDDAVTAGFDKVGEGLTLSATHFARYQEAADKALGIAMTHAGALKFEKDGIQFFEGKETMASYGNWMEGKNLVLTSRLFFPYTAILGPWVPLSGKYRVSITGQARNNDGKPVPVGIGILRRSGCRPDAPDLLDWRDLTDKEMRTVTMETDIQKDDQIHIFGPTLMHRDYVIPRHKKGERWDKQALVIQKIVIEGPINSDGTTASWPSQSFRLLFDNLKEQRLSKITGIPPAKGMPDPLLPVSTRPREDAERLIRAFLPRAFRRPVPEDLVKPCLEGVNKALTSGIAFHQAVLDAYKAILCSPRFLLHDEAPGPLDNPALANRLSYFLWNGPPDEALLQADLTQREIRHAQVERLLQDPRSARFERSFTDQWLDLKKIDDTSPDSKLYPEFDSALQLSAVRETRLVFHELIAENRSLLEGVKSDWTYVNAPLGWLYGLPEVAGYDLRKITLPPGS